MNQNFQKMHYKNETTIDVFCNLSNWYTFHLLVLKILTSLV